MASDPPGDSYPNGRDLSSGGPDTGFAVLAVRGDAQSFENSHQACLQFAQVRAEVLAPTLQVDQRVAHQLAGPVVGRGSASVAGDNIYSSVCEFGGGRQHVCGRGAASQGDHRRMLHEQQGIAPGAGGDFAHPAPLEIQRLAIVQKSQIVNVHPMGSTAEGRFAQPNLPRFAASGGGFIGRSTRYRSVPGGAYSHVPFAGTREGSSSVSKGEPVKVLGIHDAFDGGAALVVDGEIRVAINEERLNRIKNFHEERTRVFGLPRIVRSAFPKQSIDKILAMEGLSPEDIDLIAVPHARPIEFLTTIPWKFARQSWWRAVVYSPVLFVLCFLYWLNKKQLIASTIRQLEEYGFSRDKLRFVSHHGAHASAAYRTSGWDEALVIVADLEGDLTSTTVWKAQGNNFELLEESMFPFSSFGAFYGNATASIGFRKHVDECKVMGLAAYGEPRCYDEISHNLIWDAERGRVISKNPLRFRQAVAEIADQHEKKDVASSAQKRLEDVLVPFVKHWMEQTGCRRVAYGGGVAHNVIANQRLQEIPEIEGLHIFPHTGDGGLACGAALECWYDQAQRADGAVSYRLRNAYLGPEYSEEDIRAALERYDLPIEKSENAAEEAGELLAEGLVCGVYQGRMELGPRALGNRSILSTPRGTRAKDKVNNKVKFRESWRPFALSVLAECQDEYLIDATEANFMLLGFQVHPEKLEDVQSAAHVDGSTRPQTVTQEANPSYHRMISKFRELTGIGGVLNTSLNRRGEPVCCTPGDAIECFLGSDMDVLVLGDYVLQKKAVSRDKLKTFEAIEDDVTVSA